jgi:diacylglycerol kinase family enzyme
VCVPAGTRNHFALDLGVDRDDVVGALDAFTNGRERVVDLAEVNGRVLGITVLAAGTARNGDKRVQQWTAASFEVSSDEPIAAGIDGEALKLDPPLRFRTKPQALRVRIAPQHPGASPSATLPQGPWDAIRALTHIAVHGAAWRHDPARDRVAAITTNTMSEPIASALESPSAASPNTGRGRGREHQVSWG